MKTILLSILLLAGIGTYGQENRDYSTFYKTHRGTEGIVTFSLPPGLIQLVIDGEDEEKLRDLLDKTDKISFLISENGGHDLKESFVKHVPEKIYKDIMIIRDGSSTIAFKAKENHQRIEEIIMAVDEANSLTVMCWKGNFTMEDAKRFTKSIDAGHDFKITHH